MSFAAAIRNRGSERVIALISAMAVVLSMMVVFANPAQAHNGTVTWGCDGWSVNLSAYSTGGTNKVTVTVDGTQVAASTTNWSSFSRTGTWSNTQNHTLVVFVDAWDDDSQLAVSRGSNGSYSPNWQNGQYSFTLTASQTACTQNVTTTVGAGACAVNQGQPAGSVNVTINPSSGATVNVYSNSAMTNLVGSRTTSGAINGLPPGTYYWSATAANGFQMSGSSSGQVTINDCAVSVGVSTAGACDVVQGQPVGSANVTINPSSGATVNVYSNSAMTNLVGSRTTSGAINGLPPGTYYWSATPASGFDLNGASSGQFTVDTCATSVSVITDGVCVVDGQGNPAGLVQIGIDPSTAATVTVYSDQAMTDAVMSTTTGGDFDLAPGTYYWEATPSSGYSFGDGPTSGSFTIETCAVSVTVGGVCIQDGDAGVGRISIEIDVPGGVVVTVSDNGTVVDTFTESGTVSVPEGKTYSWSAEPAVGFAITGPASGEIDVDTCTKSLELVVSGVCESNAPWLSWAVTPVNFDADQVTITWNDIDSADPLHSSGQALVGRMPWPGTEFDSEGNVNDWAGWVLVDDVWSPGDDGYQDTRPQTSITFSVNPSTTMSVEYPGGEPECEGPPPTEVLASIVVTVGGACSDTNEGELDVVVSVDDGADVVIRDANGQVVGSVSSDATITVADDATYTWSATPNAGFEFPPGSDTSGSITIEECVGRLPFTGLDADVLAVISTVLLGAGATILFSQRKREEL